MLMNFAVARNVEINKRQRMYFVTYVYVNN